MTLSASLSYSLKGSLLFRNEYSFSPLHNNTTTAKGDWQTKTDYNGGKKSDIIYFGKSTEHTIDFAEWVEEYRGALAVLTHSGGIKSRRMTV